MGKYVRTFELLSNLLEADGKDLSNTDNYMDIIEEFGKFLHHDTITGTSNRKTDENFYELLY